MIDNDLLPTEGAGREEMEAAYSWTYDQAIKAQEEWELKHGSPRDDRTAALLRGDILSKVRDGGPFFRWMACQELKECYEAFKEGDKGAILDTIFVCSSHSLPLPVWVQTAFEESYREVKTHYKARSWDDVFGKPHKGKHLEMKRQEREQSHRIYSLINVIREREPGIPIDEKLFDRVGRETGLGGKTLIGEYYYKWKRIVEHK